MIDFEMYLAQCAKPTVPGECNCFTAALAAFHDSEKVAALAEWWQLVPTSLRLEFENDLVRVMHEQAMQYEFRQVPTIPTGREIGLAQFGALWPPAICVSAPGAWFARGIRGAVKLRRNQVSKAWRV